MERIELFEAQLCNRLLMGLALHPERLGHLEAHLAERLLILAASIVRTALHRACVLAVLPRFLPGRIEVRRKPGLLTRYNLKSELACQELLLTRRRVTTREHQRMSWRLQQPLAARIAQHWWRRRCK